MKWVTQTKVFPFFSVFSLENMENFRSYNPEMQTLSDICDGVFWQK